MSNKSPCQNYQSKVPKLLKNDTDDFDRKCSESSGKTVPLDRKRNTYFTPNPHFPREHLKNLLNKTMTIESNFNKLTQEKCKKQVTDAQVVSNLEKLHDRLSFIESVLLSGIEKRKLDKHESVEEPKVVSEAILIENNVGVTYSNEGVIEDIVQEMTAASFTNKPHVMHMQQNYCLDSICRNGETNSTRNTSRDEQIKSCPCDYAALFESIMEASLMDDPTYCSDPSKSDKYKTFTAHRNLIQANTIPSQNCGYRFCKANTEANSTPKSSSGPCSCKYSSQRYDKEREMRAVDPSAPQSYQRYFDAYGKICGTNERGCTSLYNCIAKNTPRCDCCGKYRRLTESLSSRSRVNAANRNRSRPVTPTRYSTTRQTHVKNEAMPDCQYEYIRDSLHASVDRILERISSHNNDNYAYTSRIKTEDVEQGRKKETVVESKNGESTTIDIVDHKPYHLYLTNPCNPCNPPCEKKDNIGKGEEEEEEESDQESYEEETTVVEEERKIQEEEKTEGVVMTENKTKKASKVKKQKPLAEKKPEKRKFVLRRKTWDFVPYDGYDMRPARTTVQHIATASQTEGVFVRVNEKKMKKGKGANSTARTKKSSKEKLESKKEKKKSKTKEEEENEKERRRRNANARDQSSEHEERNKGSKENVKEREIIFRLPPNCPCEDGKLEPVVILHVPLSMCGSQNSNCKLELH